MAEQTHTRHITDTRTVLPVVLKQPNEAGVDTIINLTGLTVEFKMQDHAGAVVVAQTSTGVSVTDASAGEVQYDFSTAGVDTTGRYYAYFVVSDGGESDHFPVRSRELIICIEGDA